MRDRDIILVVDEEGATRTALHEILSLDYPVIEATNSKEALQRLDGNTTQMTLVLLNAALLGMDGAKMLQIMRDKGRLKDIPVILIAAEGIELASTLADDLGVIDVITRPFEPDIVRHRVARVLELFHYRIQRERQEQNVYLWEQEQARRETQRSILEVLSATIEFRNCDSQACVRRVRQVTRLLLLDVMKHYPEYGLYQERVERLSDLSILHDIGKIMIPESILKKRGALTGNEIKQIRSHTVYGGELAGYIHFAPDSEMRGECYEICRHHHERWDGRGYPDGLKGAEIPIWVQAVGVADAYEALVSGRSYKQACGVEDAVRRITEGECGVFSPKMIRSLRRVLPSLLSEFDEKVAEQPEVRYGKWTEALPRQRVGMSCSRKQPAIHPDAKILLNLEREKSRVMGELSQDMVFTYNALFDSMEFSNIFCHTFRTPNYINHVKKQMASLSICDPEEYEQLMEKRRELSWKKPKLEMDLRLTLPDGSRPWFHLVLHILLDEDRTRKLGYVGKLMNINRIKREAVEWKKRANTDALTQLCNRAGAHIMFETLLRENREQPVPLTVAFMDVDHFKELNDTLGHEAGDQILSTFSRNICRMFRPDDIVSRFGGDEFLVVIKNVGNRKLAQAKLEKLCHQVIPLSGTHRAVEITSSIGAAFYPADGVEFSELLRKADQALYESKRKGRGRVSFYVEE